MYNISPGLLKTVSQYTSIVILCLREYKLLLLLLLLSLYNETHGKLFHWNDIAQGSTTTGTIFINRRSKNPFDTRGLRVHQHKNATVHLGGGERLMTHDETDVIGVSNELVTRTRTRVGVKN